MSLSSEEQYRRETAREVLCAMLSNQALNANVSSAAKQQGINPNVVLSDMAILQAETFIDRLKLCRHKNLEKVQVQNLDGSRTCPDCMKDVK